MVDFQRQHGVGRPRPPAGSGRRARPLYLVKLDVRDYYPSIPHNLLLTILGTLGVRQPELDLVAKFLAMPHAASADGSGSTTGHSDTGKARPVTRGVPMGYRLSALLAGVLLPNLSRWYPFKVPNSTRCRGWPYRAVTMSVWRCWGQAARVAGWPQRRCRSLRIRARSRR